MGAKLVVPHRFNTCFSAHTKDIQPWKGLTPTLRHVSTAGCWITPPLRAALLDVG